MPQEDKPLTTAQVAHLFNVSTEAVRDWADQGKLPHFKTPGGRRRFRHDDVARFLRGEVA